MLDIEIINQMDVDELRNYCVHLIALVESNETLIEVQAQLIDAFKNLYNVENFKNERSLHLKIEKEKISTVEQELNKKYEI